MHCPMQWLCQTLNWGVCPASPPPSNASQCQLSASPRPVSLLGMHTTPPQQPRAPRLPAILRPPRHSGCCSMTFVSTPKSPRTCGSCTACFWRPACCTTLGCACSSSEQRALQIVCVRIRQVYIYMVRNIGKSSAAGALLPTATAPMKLLLCILH